MKILKWLGLVGLFFGSSAFPTELNVDNWREAKLHFEIETSSIARVRIYEKKGKREGNEIYNTIVEPSIPSFSVLLPSGNYEIKADEGYFLPEQLPVNVGDDVYIKDGEAFYTQPIKLNLIELASIQGLIHGPDYIISSVRKLGLKKEASYEGWPWDEEIKIFNGKLSGKIKPGSYKSLDLMFEDFDYWNFSKRAEVTISPPTIECKPGKNWLEFYVQPKRDKARVSQPGFKRDGEKLSKRIKEVHLIKKPSGYERPEELLVPLGTDDISYGKYLIEAITDENEVYRKKVWILPIKDNHIWFNVDQDKVDYPLISAKEIFSGESMIFGIEESYNKNLPVLIGDKKYNIEFTATDSRQRIDFSFSINGKNYNVFSFSHKEMKEKARPGECHGDYYRSNDFIVKKTIFSYPFKVESKIDNSFIYDEPRNYESGLLVFKLYQFKINESDLEKYFNINK